MIHSLYLLSARVNLSSFYRIIHSVKHTLYEIDNYIPIYYTDALLSIVLLKGVIINSFKFIISAKSNNLSYEQCAFANTDKCHAKRPFFFFLSIFSLYHIIYCYLYQNQVTKTLCTIVFSGF